MNTWSWEKQFRYSSASSVQGSPYTSGAILNETKKRKRELQYIIAGINNAALQKQQAWQNQISLIAKPETQSDWETARLYVRAKDDFAELASLTIALEGTIDVEGSAISDMMDKYLASVRKNNELQAEVLKNPTLNKENVPG